MRKRTCAISVAALLWFALPSPCAWAQVQTPNWGGYEVLGADFNVVNANWTVPKVAYAQYPSHPPRESSAVWVGIGGAARSHRTDSTLIQAGTWQNVDSSNTESYSAWYEMLPDPPVRLTKCVGDVSCTVKPGDIMYVIIELKNPKQNPNLWLIVVQNLNKNIMGKPIWVFSKTVTYHSSQRSAEWIVEATNSTTAGHYLPLPNSDPVLFQYIQAGKLNTGPFPQSYTLAANGDLLVDPWGGKMRPCAEKAHSIGTYVDVYGNFYVVPGETNCLAAP